MIIRFVHNPRPVLENGKLLQYQVMIPPLGLWSLADAATHYSNDVRIIHTGLETLKDSSYSFEKQLRAESPDLICFTLHWHKQVYEVFGASRAAKASCPDTKILIGGITATAFAESIMDQWRHVDFLIRGEAEKSLALLLKNDFRDPGGIPNLSWREPSGDPVHNPSGQAAQGAALDTYSHTRLDLLQNHELYRGRYFFDAASDTVESWGRSPRTWYLFVGRGCSVNCAYCGGGAKAHVIMSQRNRIAIRSPEAVFSDMKALRNNHDMNTFYTCFHPPRMPRAFYPKLFSLIRESFRPAMIFEFYDNTATDEFIADFAQTFDPEGSQLVFSPTAFTESARAHLCPSAPSNDEINSILIQTEQRRIPVVLFYSPLPQEPLEDLMRGLKTALSFLHRFAHLTIITMPIELEPLSPWAMEPGAFGIEPLRTTLQDYMTYHQRRGGVATEEDLGYRFAAFQNIMLRIAGLSQDPRWICFHPFLYDSFISQ